MENIHASSLLPTRPLLLTSPPLLLPTAHIGSEILDSGATPSPLRRRRWLSGTAPMASADGHGLQHPQRLRGQAAAACQRERNWWVRRAMTSTDETPRYAKMNGMKVSSYFSSLNNFAPSTGTSWTSQASQFKDQQETLICFLTLHFHLPLILLLSRLEQASEQKIMCKCASSEATA